MQHPLDKYVAEQATQKAALDALAGGNAAALCEDITERSEPTMNTQHTPGPWVVPPGEYTNEKQEERDWMAKNTTKQAPEGVNLKAGDKVTVTNGNGVKIYGYQIGGFSAPTKWGQCVHLVGPQCYPYWFPVHPEQIEKV